MNGTLIISLTQDGEAHGADVRLPVLDRLAVAGARNGGRDHVMRQQHFLSHAHLSQKVVGEQTVQGLARDGAYVHAVRERRRSLEEGGVIRMQLADVDGTALLVAKDRVHEVHKADDGILGDVEKEKPLLDVLVRVLVQESVLGIVRCRRRI